MINGKEVARVGAPGGNLYVDTTTRNGRPDDPDLNMQMFRAQLDATMKFNESWSALMGEKPRESTFTGDEVLEWAHADEREVFRAALGNTARGVSEEFDCATPPASGSGSTRAAR